MSQAKNKVEWCLRKARKELEGSAKHRGLVETKPDLEEAKKHIAKAEHNLKAVLSFEKAGFSDWSVSASFYTIYHCLLAVIRKHGFESRNQECTLAMIEHLLEQGKVRISKDVIEAVKTTDAEERHEISAITLREDYQYGTETSIRDGRLDDLRALCRKAIDEAKEEIYRA
ncbi:hypothetical protein JW711_05455 [Candidatus Woesearchaeota archaeon]|nr:hypothetical protein [Candidatus Woesearchaeota archaeon]